MSSPINPYLRKQLWCYRGHDIATRLPLCHCGCGQVVKPPRRTAASQACVDRYANHSDAGRIRRQVERRDKGVCALCGTDTNKLLREIRETQRLWEWLARREAEDRYERGESIREDGGKMQAWVEVYDFVRRHVREQVIEREWHHFDDHAWEADHIIPVVEGGGGCDFTGYRTLCMRCHKHATRELAGRRAVARRIKKQPELNLT